MGQPFIGEIRMFGGSFAPAGWAMCQGQLMPISQNDTLFNLIGTTYGGDGQETFGLPNLSGRVPLHQGTLSGITYVIGEAAGTESVTLTTQQIPSHNHAFLASTDTAGSPDPGQNTLPANSAQVKIYSLFPVASALAANALSPVGGSQPHENMMPFLVITFIISLFGIFPTQN
jgi:microcystin-dependent protein